MVAPKAGVLNSEPDWVPNPLVAGLLPNSPVPPVWVCPNGVVVDEPKRLPVAGLLPNNEVVVVGVPKIDVCVVVPKPVEEPPKSGLFWPNIDDCVVVAAEPNKLVDVDGCDACPKVRPPVCGPFRFAK